MNGTSEAYQMKMWKRDNDIKHIHVTSCPGPRVSELSYSVEMLVIMTHSLRISFEC